MVLTDPNWVTDPRYAMSRVVAIMSVHLVCCRLIACHGSFQGAEAVGSGWAISTMLLEELAQLQSQNFLLVNFFEFMAALWPHVLAAVQAGTFADEDSDFKTNGVNTQPSQPSQHSRSIDLTHRSTAGRGRLFVSASLSVGSGTFCCAVEASTNRSAGGGWPVAG